MSLNDPPHFLEERTRTFFDIQGNSDQFRFLGNCQPTPPLRRHFAQSEK